MKSRINLHTPGKKRSQLQVKGLAGSVAIIVCVVVVVGTLAAGLSWYAGSKADYLASVKQELKTLKSEVVKEQQKRSAVKVRSELLAEQQRTQQQINARKTLLSLLHQIEPGQRSDFSDYLKDLSLASKPQSWLTSFKLDNALRQFVMYGAAGSAPDVPAMLQEMGKTETFAGMDILTLEVTATDAGVNFQAQTGLKVND